MYSTTQNFTTKKPAINKTGVCLRYLTYPVDDTITRVAEGGLRIQGKYKKSLPDKPLLTVYTAVLNAVTTIEKCILSVLEQNHDNVEYIIVDGGSTDGTLEIIQKYEDAIDYYVSEPDRNHCHGMNKCLELCSGYAMNLMCADNFFLKNVFVDYVNELKKKEIEIVYSYQYIIDEEGNYIDSRVTFDTVMLDALAHETFFVTKKVMETVGYYNETYTQSFCMEFFLKMYFIFGREHIKLLKKPTIVYYPEGISKQQLDTNKAGTLEIYYNEYGKQLGLTKEYIRELVWYRDDQFESLNAYSQLELIKKRLKKLFEIEVTSDNHNLLFELIVQSLRHVEFFYRVEVITQNFWYVFDQSSIREKCILLVKKIFKKIFLFKSRFQVSEKNS